MTKSIDKIKVDDGGLNYQNWLEYDFNCKRRLTLDIIISTMIKDSTEGAPDYGALLDVKHASNRSRMKSSSDFDCECSRELYLKHSQPRSKLFSPSL